MAAIFYRPNPNERLFRGGFPAVTAARIPILDGIADGPRFHSIITNIGVENSETIQYFLTFDDVVSYFYFGKGMGAINVRGLLFSDCEGRVPGINALYNVIGNNRGSDVAVSIGSVGFTCVISNFTVNLDADQMLAEFSLTMPVINHTLRPKRVFPSC